MKTSTLLFSSLLAVLFSPVAFAQSTSEQIWENDAYRNQSIIQTDEEKEDYRSGFSYGLEEGLFQRSTEIIQSFKSNSSYYESRYSIHHPGPLSAPIVTKYLDYCETHLLKPSPILWKDILSQGFSLYASDIRMNTAEKKPKNNFYWSSGYQEGLTAGKEKSNSLLKANIQKIDDYYEAEMKSTQY